MQVGKSRRPHGHPGNASPFNVSGLHSRNLRELVGQGDQHADFAFAYGAPEGPRAFVSTIKLRQAGFAKTVDTEDSFRSALQSLIDHKLPAARREVIRMPGCARFSPTP